MAFGSPGRDNTQTWGEHAVRLFRMANPLAVKGTRRGFALDRVINCNPVVVLPSPHRFHLLPPPHPILAALPGLGNFTSRTERKRDTPAKLPWR